MFQYDAGKTPGLAFLEGGTHLFRYGTRQGRVQNPHGNTVYWLVGDEVEVGKPLDVEQVFRIWRSRRPGIASTIVIVDLSGEEDRSKPIRSALDDAGIRYTPIHGSMQTKLSRSGNKVSNLFSVGDSRDLKRRQFGTLVESISKGMALNQPVPEPVAGSKRTNTDSESGMRRRNTRRSIPRLLIWWVIWVPMVGGEPVRRPKPSCPVYRR